MSEAIDRLRLDAPGVGLSARRSHISAQAVPSGSPRALGTSDPGGRASSNACSHGEAGAGKALGVVSAIPALLVVGLSALSVDFRNGIMTPAGTFSLVVATILDIACDGDHQTANGRVSNERSYSSLLCSRSALYLACPFVRCLMGRSGYLRLLQLEHLLQEALEAVCAELRSLPLLRT